MLATCQVCAAFGCTGKVLVQPPQNLDPVGLAAWKHAALSVLVLTIRDP